MSQGIIASAASAVGIAGASAAAVTAEWHARAGDWGGWLLSNLLVGGLAPAIAIGVHKASKRFGRTKANLTVFDAYRGAATGFISLGWLAGAMADLTKQMTSEGSILPIQVWLVVVVAILTLGATYMAVVGMAPVIPTDPTQAPQPPTHAQLNLQHLQYATTDQDRQAIVATLQPGDIKAVLYEALKQREDEATKLEGAKSYALNRDADMLRWSLYLAVVVFGVSAWIHGVTS